MKKKAANTGKTASKKLSLLQIVIHALEDLKAQNIVTLDVSALTDVTDKLVIASGTSSRQVRAIAENAMEEAKKQGFPAMSVEGLDAGDWVLVDFVDIVVHVMLPETREFYDLERLWQTPETEAAATAMAARKITTERKADYGKTRAEKPAFDSQHATARARKTVGKTATATRKSTAAKATTEKTGVAKAGVYAKTGTRKPAAAKPTATTASKKKTASAKPKAATTKKTTTPKAPANKSIAKPAAGSAARSAIGISTAAKNRANTPKTTSSNNTTPKKAALKKTAPRKPRAS